VVRSKVLSILHSLLDCAGEVIEYHEETALTRGRSTEAVWDLVESHMAAASVAADHIQQRRAASLLLTVLISSCGCPDGAGRRVLACF
jgi:hypothetical protein